VALDLPPPTTASSAQNTETPEIAPPHLEGAKQITPPIIDLEPDEDPPHHDHPNNEGGFISEVQPSQPYFDLTGDNEWEQVSGPWAELVSPVDRNLPAQLFFTTSKPKRSVD